MCPFHSICLIMTRIRLTRADERRRMRTKRAAVGATAAASVLLVLPPSALTPASMSMFFVPTASAFQPPLPMPVHDITSMSLPSIDLALGSAAADFKNFDASELLFRAQSVASDLAAKTLGPSSSAASATAATAALTLTPTSLLLLYVAGLLTSFSPCSLSLLPLTISYISTSTSDRSDKTSLLPTLAFAAGLASVFVGLGLSVSLLGAGVFGATTQAGVDDDVSLGKLALVALSSGVSIAMGLQLLDIIRIPLPSFEIDMETMVSSGGDATKKDGQDAVDLDGNSMASESMASEICFDEDGNLIPAPSTTKGAESECSNNGGKSNGKSSGGGNSSSLLRTFLLGGSSALIASPCATPVLTSILAYVATSQNPTLGAALLFTYTLGYSTPLLVVGATGGQALAQAQAAASGDGEGGGSIVGSIGKLVTPMTASILIWYGTNGFLEGMIGDPSLSALAPILD